MKDHKFRVWDGERMWEPEEYVKLDLHSGEWHFVFKGEQSSEQHMIRHSEAHLLHYTGLTDAMGQEIYSKHIVEVNGFGSPRYVVEQRRACIRPFGPDAYFSPEDCRVIGDVFQHPELIEAKTRALRRR